MQISKIIINNFANFSELDIVTGESIVLVGENKSGKSNFVRALQILLDPSLSERDRQLNLDHFWDGLGENKLGETVEIAVELTDFTNDPRLMAHLNDCVVDPGPPMVARLNYRFQPKANLGRTPESLADYEYIIDHRIAADLLDGAHAGRACVARLARSRLRFLGSHATRSIGCRRELFLG